MPLPDFDPTPEQQEILDHDPSRHARLLAGPGTGKSATLVAYVDQLLSREPRPRLRLLTFTRAATGELARKVSEHPAAATLRPSTIHSFAISVLLQNLGAGGILEPLRIADDWENANIVRPRLARMVGVTVPRVKVLINEMAAGWESLEPEHDPRIDTGTRARFHGAWDEHRRVFGYTLLPELPYALRKALLEHDDLAGVDYDLLIVDEYQDLNACDLEVLRMIAARGCRVIGAGDDDQSIYAFRKAAPIGIRRFPDDYPGAADYSLSVTKRCGSRIIEWAGHVIAGDLTRPPDRAPLTSAEESPPGEVALLSFAGHMTEVRGIASLIEKLNGEEGVPLNEILVLFRTDHNGVFSNPLKDELARREIPCSDPDVVKRMLAEPTNRRMLAVFKVLVDRRDSLAWATLLRITVGIAPPFSDYIYERARDRRLRFGDALFEALDEAFPGAAGASPRRAQELIESVLAWLNEHELPAEDDQECDEEGPGWGKWMIEASGGDVVPAPSPEFQDLLLALDELVEREQGLGRYLGQIAPLGKDFALTESQGVRIMSMAGAKGLTVRAAIVAALEDGIVPLARAEVDLREERRLLYVAMTRAKEYVFGTWAQRRRGATARAGAPRVGQLRSYSNFFEGGPVNTQDGNRFIEERWP